MSAANHNLTDSARLAAPKGGFGFKSELRDADKAHTFVFPRTRGNWDSFMGEDLTGRKMGLPLTKALLRSLIPRIWSA